MGVAQVGAEESVTEEAAAGLGEAVLVTGQAVLVTEQAGAVQAEAEQAAEVGQGDKVLALYYFRCCQAQTLFHGE